MTRHAGASRRAVRLAGSLSMTSAILVFLAAVVSAQTTGTMTGTVVDLGGDAVANAPIRATNVATKALYTATTTGAGTYTFAQLPAGTYDLTADVLGFNGYSQKNVTVAAGQTLRFDIRLTDYQLGTLGDGREFRVDLLTPHPTPSGPTPRTADGKPDLSGVWYAQRTVDPGKPDPLPWADALQKERAANNSKDSPGAHCLPRGVTNAGALFPYKLVQTPTLLVMLFEDDTPSHRQVFLDGRGHPKDLNPNWFGHSIGRWDGDTLVVETVGQNDITWIDAAGIPHSTDMKVTERIRRPDYGHLEIEHTIDDPKTFSRPWSFTTHPSLLQGELIEYICQENNKDVEHLVGK